VDDCRGDLPFVTDWLPGPSLGAIAGCSGGADRVCGLAGQRALCVRRGTGDSSNESRRLSSGPSVDPSICDHIYLEDTATDCREWFALPESRRRWREDRRPPGAEQVAGCATETARQELAFRDALAAQDQSFSALCRVLGVPDWVTGSEMAVFIYEVSDGGEIRLGFETPDRLSSAYLVTTDGQQIDLLADR